ncbi:MAG: hypothetical protein ACOYWZ_20610 [Bacillota bacterium]
MKLWTLALRIILALLAYGISFILLFYTPLYQDIVYWTGSGLRVFIVTNLIAALVTGAAYLLYKNALTVVNIICMTFCTPAVMSHSKLTKQILGINPSKYLTAHYTALLFLAVVILLLVARRLKRLEIESDALILSGANEENVKIILGKSIKLYYMFTALVSVLCIVLIGIGFMVLHINGSKLAIVLTAASGIVLIIGCVVFIYRRWSTVKG